jgi:hypothetical protein
MGQSGLAVCGAFESPIKDVKGNRGFSVYLEHRKKHKDDQQRAKQNGRIHSFD